MLKTLKEIPNLKNKRILLRCDFNVPIKSKGRGLKSKIKITNSLKIDSALSTIRYLQKQGAVIIIASHMGRPMGHIKKELSLFPVAKYLSKKLYQEIIFVEDFLDINFAKATKEFKSGEVILLENLRFHAGEENNSITFAKKIARLADLYF